MAIGTAAAIGLGVAGIGSALSSRSNSRAASRAAQASTDNNAENVALAREVYGNNERVLNPFVTRGNAAGDQINALLGLGGTPAQQQPQPNALSQFTGSPYATRGTAGLPYGLGDAYIPGFNPAAFGDAYGFGSGGIQPDIGDPATNGPFGAPGYGDGLPTSTGLPTSGTLPGSPTGQTAQEAANDAFDIFRNSTGYQFRLGEGLDAVNSGYAGAGTLQSGAAMRAINEYGQNFASNEFSNYLNALGSQQAVGAGAASSLAGVGQNFAGTVINSNNLNTTNQMNAQLSRGGNNALANFAGTIGGGLFGYGAGR